jgi:hypothetical protein
MTFVFKNCGSMTTSENSLLKDLAYTVQYKNHADALSEPPNLQSVCPEGVTLKIIFVSFQKPALQTNNRGGSEEEESGAARLIKCACEHGGRPFPPIIVTSSLSAHSPRRQKGVFDVLLMER